MREIEKTKLRTASQIKVARAIGDSGKVVAFGWAKVTALYITAAALVYSVFDRAILQLLRFMNFAF